VLAERTRWRWSDDYATRFRDPDVADHVRASLRYDRALGGTVIDVQVEQGRVRLRGRAPSEAAATQAIARALDVDGVVQVEAWLVTPEAPGPPVTGGAEWCPS
jgi:osmotically-inducible protein OsmY